jgi:hypothetical protein
MTRDPVRSAPPLLNRLVTIRPWPLLLAGLVITIVGLTLSQTSFTGLRVGLIGLGVVLAGGAVARRLQTAEWELEDRVESAGLLAVSAFVALLAFLGTYREWDSARRCLGALIALALLGSLLVLLPALYRKIAISLLVILHFGGILTAVTAVPPREEQAPWLAMQLWTRFYRPYLTFMYLTNAYHFYSPDPGPPQLLWFRIEYTDRSYRWIKIPNRKESPVGLHYQRLLALTESTNQPMPMPLPLDQVPEWETHFGVKYPRDNLNEIMRRRTEAGSAIHPEIQLAVDLLPANQYSEPQELSKKLIASYARHIALTSPHPTISEVAVDNVRIYRVTHRLISPAELVQGKSALDPIFYMPYYMGKFDVHGNLLDPKDPFLYWYLPIVWVDQRYPEPGTAIRVNAPPPPNKKLLDCVKIHAGDTE